MDAPFYGYIKPKREITQTGEFILQPVFVVPVEVFTRGLLRRPEYRYYQAVVDASTGKAEYFPEGAVSVIEREPPAGKTLPPVIGASKAAAVAESEARHSGREGWRAVLGSAYVTARSDRVIATWRVWLLSDNSMTDSLTGRKIDGAVFLADFLNDGGKEEK
ncbi:MAG: hypothetical protein ACP5CD_00880 [Thermovirgaceae bacterium]